MGSRSGRLTDLVDLANASPADSFEVSLGNSLPIKVGDDGWALLSAYGEHPHSKGVQVFTKADAEEMVGYFHNAWNRIKRAITGLPMFKGHPDVPGLERHYPDKTVYGSISDLQARDEGLFFKPVLTPDGAGVVEKGAEYVSPYWKGKPIGMQNGVPRYAPKLLVSVGLTPTPNIPGPSLANSNLIMDLTALIKLLGLANDATEADVNTRISELMKRPETASLANEQTARTTAENKVTDLTKKLSEATTAFENERNLRLNGLLDAAIKEGRIVEADKAVWERRLKADFANESVALANAKAIKTEATTKGRREDARKVFEDLVNEAMPSNGHDRQKAWAAVLRTDKGAKAYKAWETAAKPEAAAK